MLDLPWEIIETYIVAPHFPSEDGISGRFVFPLKPSNMASSIPLSKKGEMAPWFPH